MNQFLARWLESLSAEEKEDALDRLGELASDEKPDLAIIGMRKGAGLPSRPHKRRDKIREAAGLPEGKE